jgi:methylenetetrahydrofolate reductase (NADPH)
MIPVRDQRESAAMNSAVRKAYVEIFPTSTIVERLALLQPGSHVAVTCSPAKGVDETVAFSETITRLGYKVIPHLAARAVRDRAHLVDITTQLTELGIDIIFVPGGDAAKPVGSYSTALDLLRDLAETGNKFRRIGIAAHPEGHPDASDAALIEALQLKQPLAHYLVSQMCFDTRRLAAWLRDIRERGIVLPIWLGIPGVSDRAALLKTSLRIGVGDSLRFLKRKSEVVSRLMRTKNYTPDELLGGIAPMLVDEALKVRGFHVFCFNQVEPFEAWRAQALAGLLHAETA